MGALEPQFHALLLELADLPAEHQNDQNDVSQWATRSKLYEDAFARKSRDDWAAIFGGTDACVAPVLTFSEARFHPHMAARGTFVAPGGVEQAAPAPRFSRTPAAEPLPPTAIGADTDAVLQNLGYDAQSRRALMAR